MKAKNKKLKIPIWLIVIFTILLFVALSATVSKIQIDRELNRIAQEEKEKEQERKIKQEQREACTFEVLEMYSAAREEWCMKYSLDNLYFVENDTTKLPENHENIYLRDVPEFIERAKSPRQRDGEKFWLCNDVHLSREEKRNIGGYTEEAILEAKAISVAEDEAIKDCN